MIKNIYKSSEISATKIRAAAASHVPGKNDIGKIIFRIGVGPNLSDSELERLIASLKKNMHLKPQKSYIDSVNKYVSKNTRSCFKNKTKENINQTTRKIRKGRTTFRRDKNKTNKNVKTRVIITRSKNKTKTRSNKQYLKTKEISLKNKQTTKKQTMKKQTTKKQTKKQRQKKLETKKQTMKKQTMKKQTTKKQTMKKQTSNKLDMFKKKSKTRKVHILSPIKEEE